MADIQANDHLTPKQYKAVAALLAEPTVRKAAESAGVSERTLYLWQKDSAFAAAYLAARRAAVQQSTARLQNASGAAVSVLLGIMARETSPPALRLRAAQAVLDLSLRAIEIEDIAARLAALEAAYAQKH